MLECRGSQHADTSPAARRNCRVAEAHRDPVPEISCSVFGTGTTGTGKQLLRKPLRDVLEGLSELTKGVDKGKKKHLGPIVRPTNDRFAPINRTEQRKTVAKNFRWGNPAF